MKIDWCICLSREKLLWEVYFIECCVDFCLGWGDFILLMFKNSVKECGEKLIVVIGYFI